MRHLRWQALIAILGMLLVAGLLIGQSRGVGFENTAAPGGSYTEALIGAPHWLNPLLDASNPVDRDIDRLIFSGLTRFDSAGRPTPDLANWIIAADQKTYQFILLPNLKWHDGAPLTTEDVAFTVKLLQETDYPGPADVSQLWQSVQVKVVNPQVIELTLPEPFAPFLDYTTIGLLPKHLLSGVSAANLANSDFNLKPVGAGPFKFKDLRVEGENISSLSLSAFEDYARERPLLNEVQFNFYPDAASAFAAYQAGRVLGLGWLGEPEREAAFKQPQLGLYTSVLPEYSLIFMNLRSDELPFFQEKKVRQALLLGLNRQAIVTDILKGQAVVANSPVLPGSWAYNQNLATIRYDPDTAADLLESAGWVFPEGAVPETDTYVRQKGGVLFSFTLITPDDPVHRAIAASAQATWAQIGIKVEVSPVDPTTLRTQYLEPRAFQAILVDFNFSGTPDPDPYPFWHETQAESGQNYGGFSDRILSELLEQARITDDLGTRARLYQSFQSRFADQTPALLLYYPVYNYAVDTKVGGVQIGPLTDFSDRFSSLAQWYIVTRRVIVEQPSK
jgi:peptide/nickel transport system substrate-binding protein